MFCYLLNRWNQLVALITQFIRVFPPNVPMNSRLACVMLLGNTHHMDMSLARDRSEDADHFKAFSPIEAQLFPPVSEIHGIVS